MEEKMQNELKLTQPPEIHEAILKMADHNRLTDEQVWLSMWTATMNSIGCQTTSLAAKCADNGLVQFKQRFRIK